MSVKFTVNSELKCDSYSVIKQISYSGVLDTEVTCNGIIVIGPADDEYDVIFNNPGKWVNGNWGHSNSGGDNWGIKQKIKLTNYTEVITYNNGKFILVEILKYNMYLLPSP